MTPTGPTPTTVTPRRHVAVLVLAIAFLVNVGATFTMAMPRDTDRGVPLAIVNEIVSIFEASSDEIAAQVEAGLLVESRSAAFRRARAAALIRSIDDVVQRFGAEVSPRVREAARAAVELGDAQGRVQLRETGIPPEASGVFVGANPESIEIVARDIVSKSVRAMDDLGASAKTFLRRIQSTEIADVAASRAIAKAIVTGDPKIAVREVRNAFGKPTADASYRRLGNRTIQVGKMTTSVRAYANMLVRTRTREAVVQGRHDRLSASGVNLVIITGKVSRYFCTRYIGLICSLSGNDKDWPALSSLPGGGPPFHPLCSKGTRPFVPELARDEDVAHGKRALAIFNAVGADNRDNLESGEQAAAKRRV